jgi:hypothetical protein
MKNYIEQVKGNFDCPPLGMIIGLGVPPITLVVLSMVGVLYEHLSLWISIPCIIVGLFCVSIPLWIHKCVTLRK